MNKKLWMGLIAFGGSVVIAPWCHGAAADVVTDAEKKKFKEAVEAYRTSTKNSDEEFKIQGQNTFLKFVQDLNKGEDFLNNYISGDDFNLISNYFCPSEVKQCQLKNMTQYDDQYYNFP
jgi:hypothetical protein